MFYHRFSQGFAQYIQIVPSTAYEKVISNAVYKSIADSSGTVKLVNSPIKKVVNSGIAISDIYFLIVGIVGNRFILIL